mgnify:CR=1
FLSTFQKMRVGVEILGPAENQHLKQRFGTSIAW